MRDGAVFFGTDKLTPEQLVAKLKPALQETGVPTIFIKADARSKYGATMDVVDAIQATGAAARHVPSRRATARLIRRY